MIKNIYLIVGVFLLLGCVTKGPRNEVKTPLWHTKPDTVVDLNDFIVFNVQASNLELAELKIAKEAKAYIKYIEPKPFKEFSHTENGVFLLYTIDKKEFAQIIDLQIDQIYTNFKSEISRGDSSRGLLSKYTIYKNSIGILAEVDELNKFAKSHNLEIKVVDVNRADILDKLEFTKAELIFNVTVHGDINNTIKDAIEKEIHKLGFSTSDEGYIYIESTLTLKDVELDNDYVNKFWSLSVSIHSFGEESSNSLSFKGRESQINSDALDEIIVISLKKEIEKNLHTLLP